MDPCDINHYTSILRHGNMETLSIPVLTVQGGLQNKGKKRAVKVNQDMFLYFFVIDHLPAPIQPLSGGSERWPTLQSFIQRLTERELECQMHLQGAREMDLKQ